MGVDLSGEGGDFGWDTFSWARLLRLAERYGWRPAGTLMPADELQYFTDGRWDGGYLTNDDQVVTAEDAGGLADALDVAVRDIPDDDVLAPYREEGGGIRIAPDPPEIDDRDWFCGSESKEYIRAFIGYCCAGAFRIG